MYKYKCILYIILINFFDSENNNYCFLKVKNVNFTKIYNYYFLK